YLKAEMLIDLLARFCNLFLNDFSFMLTHSLFSFQRSISFVHCLVTEAARSNIPYWNFICKLLFYLSIREDIQHVQTHL
ncbi:hypothetical protein, partial [Paenibacillus phytorum]|uniref:hypothetical protein n=1 Tax=Paenibacillus phytorum TaxID=2654977 RepID=UPI001C11E5EC